MEKGGLVKAKQYDWKDSNMEKVGSEEDYKVKKAAAKTELAWHGLDTNSPRLKIWRIENFEVKDWPVEKYGTFHRGDSYIVFNCAEKEGCPGIYDCDIHFWVGKASTADEYGTAAYKTVELDTYLDGVPVQHREVEKNESEQFKSYFKKINIIKGGVESGFKHVGDAERAFFFEYPMVQHFKKGGSAPVKVPFSKGNFYCDDGYAIIYYGDTIYQVKGANVGQRLIWECTKWLTEEKQTRYPRAAHIIFENKAELEKYGPAELLADSDEAQTQQKAERQRPPPKKFITRLIRVITNKRSSNVEYHQVETGKENIKANQLDSEDVFLLETPNRLFVWIGKKCEQYEVANAMCYATDYLNRFGQDPVCSVTCLKEEHIIKHKEWIEIMK